MIPAIMATNSQSATQQQRLGDKTPEHLLSLILLWIQTVGKSTMANDDIILLWIQTVGKSTMANDRNFNLWDKVRLSIPDDRMSPYEKGQLLSLYLEHGQIPSYLETKGQSPAWVQVSFSGADLDGMNLIGANLTMTQLSGASLRGANLYGACLSGADLRNADFTGANLNRVFFGNAKIDNSCMDDAWLCYSSLTLALGKPSSARNARFDFKTFKQNSSTKALFCVWEELGAILVPSQELGGMLNLKHSGVMSEPNIDEHDEEANKYLSAISAYSENLRQRNIARIRSQYHVEIKVHVQEKHMPADDDWKQAVIFGVDRLGDGYEIDVDSILSEDRFPFFTVYVARDFVTNEFKIRKYIASSVATVISTRNKVLVFGKG